MPALSTRARTVLVAVLVPALSLLLLPPAGASAQTPPPSPFQGKTLYVDPQSAAARDVAALRVADPTTARALERISTRSQADWFGDWNPTCRADVAARVGTITRAGAYPVLVAYDIPMRDCGSYSGGGAPSGAAYLSWIDAFRAGIGTRVDRRDPRTRRARPARLPDASRPDRSARPAPRGGQATDGGRQRRRLPRRRTRRLGATRCDGVSRLISAGVAAARGFALNVSNFGVTANEIAYGRRIAPTIGWKRFVVDTSRNGVGPATGAEAWCNPPQRELGPAPTATHR